MADETYDKNKLEGYVAQLHLMGGKHVGKNLNAEDFNRVYPYLRDSGNDGKHDFFASGVIKGLHKAMREREAQKVQKEQEEEKIVQDAMARVRASAEHEAFQQRVSEVTGKADENAADIISDLRQPETKTGKTDYLDGRSEQQDAEYIAKNFPSMAQQKEEAALLSEPLKPEKKEWEHRDMENMFQMKGDSPEYHAYRADERREAQKRELIAKMTKSRDHDRGYD